MAHLENAFEQGRTVQFLFDATNYGGFEVDTEGNRAVGCMDPRPEQRRQHMIIVQTPGGGIGIAHDTALTRLAMGESRYSPSESIKNDPSLDAAYVITGHNRCAYDAGVVSVLQETLEPGAFTLGLLKRFQRRYFDGNGIANELVRIQEAAGKAIPQLQQQKEDVLSAVDSLHPGKLTVADMVGENKAGVYTFNHHPNVGLQREKMHRGAHPLDVQTYFDCIQASLNMVWNTNGLRHDERKLRAAALIWRSAATASVLVGSDERYKLLEVEPSSKGIQVTELRREDFVE